MKFIIHFEPMEIEAADRDDAIQYYNYLTMKPEVLRVIPAKFSFDVDHAKALQVD